MDVFYYEAMLGLSSTLKIPLLEVELAVASLSQRPYLKYLKKKPNGGFRWIYAPCSELKIIQARLKDYFTVGRWTILYMVSVAVGQLKIML
jgi:hypothetical protein